MTASTALTVVCTAVIEVCASVMMSITGIPCASIRGVKLRRTITLPIHQGRRRISALLHEGGCRVRKPLCGQPVGGKVLRAMLGQNRVHQVVVLLPIARKHRQEQRRQL